MKSGDYLVIGGGLVGLAIAYGLARRGLAVTVLDEGDVAHRAARGNFGNIWIQGKGAGVPAYAEVTRRSALEWPAFAREIEEVSGVELRYRQEGAICVCFSEAELKQRMAMLAAAEADSTIPAEPREVSASELRKMYPMIGPTMAGGTLSPLDGTGDPLRLLRALLVAFRAASGTYVSGARVGTIARDGDGFAATTATGTYGAARVLLAAGLGNAMLAPQLGMRAPLRPVRGQIIVTEKLKPFMPLSFHFIRQTEDGGVICGDSSEEAGFDEGVTRPILARTADRLTTVFPFMKDVRLVRAWGALRVMSPDGLPIVQASQEAPGAFAVSVHSGVTLSPFHAAVVAASLADEGRLPPHLTQSFSPDRFDVQIPRNS